MRASLILLGFGLGILWIVGLDSVVAPWLLWLTFAAGVISIATTLLPDNRLPILRSSFFALGAGLLALWVVGLALAGASTWFAWWVFAFALTYFAIGAIFMLPSVSRRDVLGPRTV